MANVTEMPPQEGQVAPNIATESAPESATPASSPSRRPPNKGGRPKVSAANPPNPDPSFFKKVAAISAEDWGTRAYMYCYIDEPVCVAKTWGQYSYALKLKQPILDLEMLKERYGSHKGWLSLNTRKSGKDATDQIDRYEYEIFDPLCPPKIPRGAWANDTRNDRWRALLPAEVPPPNAAATSLMDSIKVYKEIRDEVRDEREEPETPFDQTRSTLETMKLAKELFAPAATPSTTTDKPADPFDTAKKIMDMRTNDPMIALLLARMDSQDKAAEEARKREYELMKELRQKEATPAKGLLDQLIELAAMGDKLEPLKKLFGFGNGTEVAGRAARTTGLDVVRDLVTGPAGATLAQGIGVLISNLASATAANPASAKAPPVFINAQQPNGTILPVENAEQRIQRIGETVTRPMLGEYFMKNATGAEWAQAMFDLWPEDYVFMRTLGAENLVNRYRRFPEAWAVIGYREQDFIKFIGEFCAWDPNADEGAIPPGNGDDGVRDLESEGEEAGS